MKTNMQRRTLVLAAAALAAGATRAQRSGPHHTLPVAPSSLDLYSKPQVGAVLWGACRE